MRLDRRAVFDLARGTVVLLAFLFAGDAVSSALRLPLPGTVVGMVLLAAALRTGLLPLAWVKAAADVLIRHMQLLYIPSGVGVIAYFGLIRREWLPLVAAGVAGMAAVLLVVGILQQWLERRG